MIYGPDEIRTHDPYNANLQINRECLFKRFEKSFKIKAFWNSSCSALYLYLVNYCKFVDQMLTKMRSCRLPDTKQHIRHDVGCVLILGFEKVAVYI